jgi:hypothetical protein
MLLLSTLTELPWEFDKSVKAEINDVSFKTVEKIRISYLHGEIIS